MSTVFIAGIGDSPWVVVVILLVGAVANWLSSRRQKLADKADGSTPSPVIKPGGEFDMEETFRRLLGQESKKPVTPPPLPRAIPTTPPPIKAWIDEGKDEPSFVWMGETQKAGDRRTVTKSPLPAAWKEISPSGKTPPAVSHSGAHVVELGVGQGTRKPHRSQRPGGAYWRKRANARQAFVASLVFGPPKGMES